MDNSLGHKAEQYIKNFAQNASILSELNVPTESLIDTLNSYSQHNFLLAKLYIESRPEMQPYPFTKEWIDQVLQGKSQPNTNEEFSRTLKSTLLDMAFSTDLLIKLNDNNGKVNIIAIDVTVKQSIKEAKLRKIRGQRGDGDPNKFNQNRNYPRIRELLGIDKHIILAIDAQKYPSHETLVTALMAIANQSTKTSLVDLSAYQEIDANQALSPRKENSPAQLWSRYSAGLTSVSARLAVDVAKRGLADNHSKDTILAILKNDPQYLAFVKKGQGDPQVADRYASSIYDKALIEFSTSQMPEKSHIQTQKRSLSP